MKCQKKFVIRMRAKREGIRCIFVNFVAREEVSPRPRQFFIRV